MERFKIGLVQMNARRDDGFAEEAHGTCYNSYALVGADAAPLVCYDSDVFESWRVGVLRGAEVILLPHAMRYFTAGSAHRMIRRRMSKESTLRWLATMEFMPRPMACRRRFVIR